MDETLRRKIEARAHELWERGDRSHGSDALHWIQAEREILDQQQAMEGTAAPEGGTTGDMGSVPEGAGAGPVVPAPDPAGQGPVETGSAADAPPMPVRAPKPKAAKAPKAAKGSKSSSKTKGVLDTAAEAAPAKKPARRKKDA